MELRSNIGPLGILGGGQLARMLVQSAHSMGFETLVFCATEHDSAALISKAIVGDVGDENFRHFLSEVTYVIFENEFMDTRALHGVTKCFPSVVCIEKLKNKVDQKKLLKRLDLPTARFLLFESGEVDPWLDEVFRQFPQGFVLKWGSQGYDGKGVVKGTGNRSELLDFCKRAREKSLGLLAEELIDFKQELALVCCRALGGRIEHYPLVKLFSRANMCSHVAGPATQLGVGEELESLAFGFAKKIGDETDLVGIFALELFETKRGQLLINEIAPRVHNTGHFTMNASVTSQFENHWRAILDWPLGSMEALAPFIMMNLVGPQDCRKSDLEPPKPPDAKCHLHWYQKTGRPLRKLGHMNRQGTIASLEQDLKALLKWRDEWEKEVSRG